MSKFTFIDTPCPPSNKLVTSAQELTQLYHYTRQLKSTVEQARRDYFQTLSEYTSSLQAKSPTEVYLRERAEAHISAALAVHHLQEPFYRAIKALVEFLHRNAAEWGEIVDPKFFEAWKESTVKRHNFICANELLKECFDVYSQLNQVEPALMNNLLQELNSSWEEANAECATWPMEMPFRAHNEDSQALADLLIRTLSLATSSKNTFHINIDPEAKSTVEALIALMKKSGWKIEQDKEPVGSARTTAKVRKPLRRTAR